uniref:GDNF/GAS1 domain-containing protein n=1 Tax=Eptatretus burgeri TaxID=7764 RepID=A0A8C4NG93_EPTBU
MLLQVVLVVFTLSGLVDSEQDCVKAVESCRTDEECTKNLDTLQGCLSAQEKSSECAEALHALRDFPVTGCTCSRGDEEITCLNLFWSIWGNDQLVSPYDYTRTSIKDLVVPHPGAVSNDACLDATLLCNRNKSCSQLRTDYIVACGPRAQTRPPRGAQAQRPLCFQHRCRRALRSFVTRAPSALSINLFLCSCSGDSMERCRMRRHKSIVPSCSHSPPRDLHGSFLECPELLSSCQSNHLCRSRWVDYQIHCQSDLNHLTRCTKRSHAACLHSFVGLIGTEIGPEFAQGGDEVRPPCKCERSANKADACRDILQMFTPNPCLESAMRSLADPDYVERHVTTMETSHWPDETSSNPSLVQSVITALPAHFSMMNTCGNEISQGGSLNSTQRGCLLKNSSHRRLSDGSRNSKASTSPSYSCVAALITLGLMCY